jgi:hypothetical protein
MQSVSGEVWVPIRIGDETGTPLDEIGLVATYANVLKGAGVPILYLGLGPTDCIMVPERDLDSAIEAFAHNEFVIRREDG